MKRYLNAESTKRFYDRMGAKQDTQSFYEDPATNELVSHSGFETATSIFEMGCGTGRFARSLFEKTLSKSCSYQGTDISETMVGLAKKRLSPWSERARVDLVTEANLAAAGDAGFDRFIANYVLDLLPPEQILATLERAHRLLRPEGKLCLVALTQGDGFLSKFISHGWTLLHRMSPILVGGCRPILIESFLDTAKWSVDFKKTISAFGIPSEILVATKI